MASASDRTAKLMCLKAELERQPCHPSILECKPTIIQTVIAEKSCDSFLREGSFNTFVALVSRVKSEPFDAVWTRFHRHLFHNLLEGTHYILSTRGRLKFKTGPNRGKPCAFGVTLTRNGKAQLLCLGVDAGDQYATAFIDYLVTLNSTLSQCIENIKAHFEDKDRKRKLSIEHVGKITANICKYDGGNDDQAANKVRRSNQEIYKAMLPANQEKYGPPGRERFKRKHQGDATSAVLRVGGKDVNDRNERNKVEKKAITNYGGLNFAIHHEFLRNRAKVMHEMNPDMQFKECVRIVVHHAVENKSCQYINRDWSFVSAELQERLMFDRVMDYFGLPTVGNDAPPANTASSG